MSGDYTLDSPLPSGSWTLYFHSPEETKWTLNTFVNIGTIKNWRDLCVIIDTLHTESFAEGMFFLMKDPYPPLWESHMNIYGGCYSMRCHNKEAADIYINGMIACMLGQMCNNEGNTVNGITISPKRGFNIIKVWNTHSKNYKNNSDINLFTSQLKHSEMLYTPFIQKKM
jgi:hypothetical protein